MIAKALSTSSEDLDFNGQTYPYLDK